MTEEELTLSILAMVMGTGVLIFVLFTVSSLVKSWINRNSEGYGEETFDRLAESFLQHKQDMEKRMEQVEATLSNTKKEIKSKISSIQIEEPDQDNYLKNKLESHPKRRAT